MTVIILRKWIRFSVGCLGERVPCVLIVAKSEQHHLSKDDARLWLEASIQDPLAHDLTGSIAIARIGIGFSNRANKLGISVQDKSFGLDLSCVRHIWHDHGGLRDKRPDQIPVSLNDILDIPTILEIAHIYIAEERPRTRGKLRLFCEAEYNRYAFKILVEIRRKLVIPVTMWKRP